MSVHLNWTGCVITVADFTGDVLCRAEGPECECLMSRLDGSYETYLPGLTSDLVVVRPGLHVITNEWRAGVILDQPHCDGWFDVRYADGHTVMQNGTRVATQAYGSAGLLDAHTEFERERREAAARKVEVHG